MSTMTFSKKRVKNTEQKKESPVFQERLVKYLGENRQELFKAFSKYDFNTQKISKALHVTEREVRDYMSEVLMSGK